MGKVCISYRHTIDLEDGPIIKEHTYSPPNFYSSSRSTKEVSLRLSVEPNPESKGNVFVHTYTRIGEQDRILLCAIEDGVLSGLRQGVKYGFPLDGIKVTLLSMGSAGHEVSATDEDLWRVCGRQAVLHTIRDSQVILKLLEPVMSVHITVPGKYLGAVLSDLKNKRRANILSVDNNSPETSDTRVIRSEVPLKEMVEYSTVLRSLTQGTASSTMEFLCYNGVSSNQEKVIINEICGY